MMKYLLTVTFVVSWFAMATEHTASQITVDSGPSHLTSVGLDVKYAPIHYSQYEMAPGSALGKSGHAAIIALEWLPIQVYGKMGIGVETGFFGIANQWVDSDRLATVYTLPIGARLNYHFDYTENQILVPYLSLGASITLVRQQSSTGADLSETLSYRGWEYSFGAQLCVNKIDPHGAKSFRRALGVDNTYLTFDYTRNQPLYLDRLPRLSYEVFRLGFRLEI